MTVLHRQRIVVMGGSFNPPTIAHLRLMEAALQAANAEKGVFVPVSEAYLKRKLRKSGECIRLTEQMRLDMLQAMCKGKENLYVSDLEIRNPMLRTKGTMQILKEQHPSAKLYFTAGADKLPLLGNWASHSDFFEHFGMVLFSREGTDTEEMLRQDERFAPFQASCIHARQPDGLDGISSTAVRKLILNRQTDEARQYLHEDVWMMIRHLTPEDFPPEIERFQGEYAFLSNLYPSPIVRDGLTFSCAEAAFQAARCVQLSDKKRIAQGDGSRAKCIAATVEPSSDWDERKLAVMEEILRAKFTQYPEMACKLAATGNAVLIHGNNGKENYWGKNLYTDQGENHLGQLLMKLRNEWQSDKEMVEK